jgi:hypothetical protein
LLVVVPSLLRLLSLSLLFSMWTLAMFDPIYRTLRCLPIQQQQQYRRQQLVGFFLQRHQPLLPSAASTVQVGPIVTTILSQMTIMMLTIVGSKTSTTLAYTHVAIRPIRRGYGTTRWNHPYQNNYDTRAASSAAAGVGGGARRRCILLPHHHHHHGDRSKKFHPIGLAFSSQPTTTASSSSSSSPSRLLSSSRTTHDAANGPPPPQQQQLAVINLSTVTLSELEALVVGLQYPKYRAQQIYHYIRNQGILDIQQMQTLPKALREQLQQYCTASSLQLVHEQVSPTDQTIKRVYELHDGNYIESVLMGPYQDGRYTACISSQVGCAQQCIFCATGQMGFQRQLTSSEIFEQVSRFHAELLSASSSSSSSSPEPIASASSTTTSNPKQNTVPQRHGKTKRLSNVVFMGMGEVGECGVCCWLLLIVAACIELWLTIFFVLLLLWCMTITLFEKKTNTAISEL